MVTILPERTSGAFKIENTEIDPGLLYRCDNALIQQGFVKQAERLATIAAERRAALS